MIPDDYSHDDPNIFYISDNICSPANGEEERLVIFEDFQSEIATRCLCSGKCLPESCSCINSEANYHRNLLSLSKRENICLPLFECNKNCLCIQDCENRVVQNGPDLNLIVRDCDDGRGLGLFTKKTLKDGSFVCTYSGEVISQDEAIRRHCRNAVEGKMNYIFSLKEHCNLKITETIVDAGTYSNIGRYINHSCEPSCIVVPVRIDSPSPHLAVFTCKDLNPGSEITYDYGPHCLKANTIDKLKKCLCASKLCRQWLPFDN